MFTWKTAEKHTAAGEKAAATASERIEEVANSAKGQIREVAAHVDAVAGDVGAALGRSVRERPGTTMAVACVAAFVLGALWKS